MGRADGRADDELRPVRFTRGFQQHPAGSVLVEFGGTKVLCAASVTTGVPRWRKGSGSRLAHRRVRDAAVGDARAQRPRVGEGPGRRPHARDLPVDRPIAAGLRRSARRSARTPSPSTATSCRPTAAPGPPPSPVPTSRSRTPSPTCGNAAAGRPAAPVLPDRRRFGRRRRRPGAARPAVRGGRQGRGGHERGRHRRRAPWSRCRAPPRARRSPARTLDAMIDSALAGIERLTALQRAALAEPLPPRECARRMKPTAPRQRIQATVVSRVLLASRNARSSAELQRILGDQVAGARAVVTYRRSTRSRRPARPSRRTRWRRRCRRPARPARSAWPTIPGWRSTR